MSRVHSLTSLEEGDEARIGLMGKPMCIWYTQNIMQHMPMVTFHKCLTILLFISLK